MKLIIAILILTIGTANATDIDYPIRLNGNFDSVKIITYDNVETSRALVDSGRVISFPNDTTITIDDLSVWKVFFHFYVNGVAADLMGNPSSLDIDLRSLAGYKATGFSTHSAADVYATFISGSNEDVFKADVSALALEASLFDPTVDSVIVDGTEFKKLAMWNELLSYIGWGEFEGKEIWSEFKAWPDADTLFVGYKTSTSTQDTTGYQVDFHPGMTAADPPDSTKSYEVTYP